MIFETCVVVHKAIKFLVALVLLLSLHVYIKPEMSFYIHQCRILQSQARSFFIILSWAQINLCTSTVISLDCSSTCWMTS